MFTLISVAQEAALEREKTEVGKCDTGGNQKSHEVVPGGSGLNGGP